MLEFIKKTGLTALYLLIIFLLPFFTFQDWTGYSYIVVCLPILYFIIALPTLIKFYRNGKYRDILILLLLYTIFTLFYYGGIEDTDKKITGIESLISNLWHPVTFISSSIAEILHIISIISFILFIIGSFIYIFKGLTIKKIFSSKITID